MAFADSTSMNAAAQSRQASGEISRIIIDSRTYVGTILEVRPAIVKVKLSNNLNKTVLIANSAIRSIN